MSGSKATPKQTFCLYKMLGMDVRPLQLTLGDASKMISEAKQNGTENLRAYISEMMKQKFPNGVPVVENKAKQYADIYKEAMKAGLEAGNAHNPTPMVVQQHANMFDDNSPVVQQWKIDGGVCGFAWVHLSKANTSFAAWCRKNKIGGKSYYGGWDISCHEFGQSMERKEKWAAAFANVLSSHGITAYMQSRMD